jgi:hypothetical protein
MILWFICKTNSCQLASTAKLDDYHTYFLNMSTQEVLEVASRITLSSPWYHFVPYHYLNT